MSESNGLATRESLLANTARRFEIFELPDGSKVRVRSLTELERQKYELASLSKKGELLQSRLLTMKCRLIVLCIVDADGNPVFTDADVSALQEQDSQLTNALADVCQHHAGISDADIEGLEKNSVSTIADDSLTT